MPLYYSEISVEKISGLCFLILLFVIMFTCYKIKGLEQESIKAQIDDIRVNINIIRMNTNDIHANILHILSELRSSRPP